VSIIPGVRCGTTAHAAYTLLEQTMVMALIGLMLAMVVGLSQYASGRADESIARAELEAFRNALASYVAEYGRCPGDHEFTTEQFQKRLPPGFSFRDPWDHAYVYVSNAPLAFTVFSVGLDGEANTTDDIHPGR